MSNDSKSLGDKYIKEMLGGRLSQDQSIEEKLQAVLKQFIQAKDYRFYPSKRIPTKMDACDQIVLFAEARPDLISDEIQDYLVREFDACNESSHLVILRILAILKEKRHLPFFRKIIDEKKWHDWTLRAAEEGIAVLNGLLKIAPHANLGTRWIFNEFKAEISENDPSLQELIDNDLQNIKQKVPETGRDLETKDKERQLQQLQHIYDAGLMAPKFRRLKKYETEKDVGPPFIRYSDVMARRFIIRRGGKNWMNSFCDEKTDILVEYKSLEELVNDGWRLD